jgi:uncharacterized protein (TIGR03000 family)
MYSIVLMAAMTTTTQAPTWQAPWGWPAYWGWTAGYGYGYGCCGCWGGYSWGSVQRVLPLPPAKPEVVPFPKEEKKKGATAPTPATLIVDLPEDARLFVDDQFRSTPGGRRTFTTPALQPGQDFYYLVRAEVIIDGKSHVEARRVIVWAGQTAEVTFPDLVALTKSRQAYPISSGAR